jgi:hypothetical protein
LTNNPQSAILTTYQQRFKEQQMANDIQIRVFGPGRSQQVLTANNPKTLRAIFDKCEKNNLKFQIQQGMEYCWVHNAFMNWMEAAE